METQRPVLSGYNLRTFLTMTLHDCHQSLSVPQLAEVVVNAGFSIRGRPSQVISDALRVEMGRGRVRRIKRGRYAFGQIPKSTKNRYRARVQASRRLVHSGSSAVWSGEISRRSAG